MSTRPTKTIILLEKTIMKPLRPFIVEIKRRGRKSTTAAAKSSIWPDPSVFREVGADLPLPTPTGATPARHLSAPAAHAPRILQDKLADAVDMPARASLIDSMPKPTTSTPVRQKPRRQPDANTSVAKRPDIPAERSEPLGEDSMRPPRVRWRKSRRWARKNRQEYPAGQRWKRRLPKVLR
uniref:Uncharacterized protein n=1 Tax=Chelativorans sp. (strain BNC1) TaxID=266779 RepID=Q11MZ7_CHESB